MKLWWHHGHSWQGVKTEKSAVFSGWQEHTLWIIETLANSTHPWAHVSHCPEMQHDLFDWLHVSLKCVWITRWPKQYSCYSPCTCLVWEVGLEVTSDKGLSTFCTGPHKLDKVSLLGWKSSPPCLRPWFSHVRERPCTWRRNLSTSGSYSWVMEC